MKQMAMPIVREINLTSNQLICALLRMDASRRVSILDSGGARAPDARYLIAGFDPFEIIEMRGNKLRIERRGASANEMTNAGETSTSLDALRVLNQRLEKYRVEHSIETVAPVAGACIATFSYDLVHCLERLRHKKSRRQITDEPDAAFAFYDMLAVHDYARDKTEIICVSGRERLEEFQHVLNEAAKLVSLDDSCEPDNDPELNAHRASVNRNSAAASPSSFSKPDFLSKNVATSNFTRERYVGAVHRIKQHIAAGDIYQANLTQQFSVQLNGHPKKPEHIFLQLQRDHPASFAAFIRRREDVIISASPERFLRVEIIDGERRAEAWPIKGTRPRGRDAAQDARLRIELQQSEKDRAENVMIVDLLRNDLGRVCKYGSIEVPELFTIQEHPTLFHLVSKVRGLLRTDATACDLLRAAFPCGSITGAPKIRAMEIIDDVETVARGLSMGAIGYFSFDGRMDTSVAIRTMTVRDGAARFNVGGGIVADSDPDLEYEESLLKAQALLRALGVQENNETQRVKAKKQK